MKTKKKNALFGHYDNRKWKYLGDTLTYKMFCFVIFIIQSAIAMLNFKISKRHRAIFEYDSMTTDILCGISWTATGLYWLYLCLSSTA